MSDVNKERECAPWANCSSITRLRSPSCHLDSIRSSPPRKFTTWWCSKLLCFLSTSFADMIGCYSQRESAFSLAQQLGKKSLSRIWRVEETSEEKSNLMELLPNAKTREHFNNTVKKREEVPASNIKIARTKLPADSHFLEKSEHRSCVCAIRKEEFRHFAHCVTDVVTNDLHLLPFSLSLSQPSTMSAKDLESFKESLTACIKDKTCAPDSTSS